MATKAESVHAEEQKHGMTPKARKRAKARKTPAEQHAPHETAHAGAKASYAKEARATTTGRASRKSTRTSANRAKPDTNLTLREERSASSPENRFRRERIRRDRVRGASA